MPTPRPGLQGGQQASFGASDFENFLVRVDMETIDLQETAVIPLSHAAPGIALAGNGIPVGYAGLPVGLSCGIKCWVCCHRHDFTWRRTDWKGDSTMYIVLNSWTI